MTSDSPVIPPDSQTASDVENTQSVGGEQAAQEQFAVAQAQPEASSTETTQQENPVIPEGAITRPAPDPHKNPLRPKIHVGSRRSKGPGDIKSSKPQVARKDQPVAEEAAQAAAAAADSLSKPIVESLPIEAVAPTRADIPKPSRAIH